MRHKWSGRRHNVPIVLVLTLTLGTCSTHLTSTTSPSLAILNVKHSKFVPPSIIVSAGHVTLSATNDDSIKHTFTLDDGTSSTLLAPGKTVTIELNATATVGFHCSIHPRMTGTLKIS